MTDTELRADDDEAILVRKKFRFTLSDYEAIEYTDIVGSNRVDGLMFLIKDGGTEFVINMEYVVHITIWTQ